MKRIKIKSLILLIIILILISLFYGCLERNPPSDSEQLLEEENESIQKLINNASPGEIINIPKGTYYENIVINKSIFLIGENKITTILDGSKFFNGSRSVVSILSDNVEIRGFTIQNGFIGIDVKAHNTTIIGNIIKNNSNISSYEEQAINDFDILSYSLAGINLYSSTRNTIIKNIIINNLNTGIKITDNSQENNIHRNSIINNNYGIFIANSSGNRISNNNFIKNNNSAYDDSNNYWDDEEKGNYWSDYIEKYSNASKSNESWNISYGLFGGNNSDRYPLVNQINNLSIVNFSYIPKNPSTKDILQFIDYSIDDDGFITSWEWNFGDGTNSTIQNPTHKYLNNGYYTIFLNITDNLGGIKGISKNINILNMEPNVDFSYSPSLPNDLDNISFNDKSFDSDGIIVSWAWNFNDGNITYEKNVSHQYTNNGIYTVTLTVKDDDGDSNSTMREINILNIPPTPIFTINPSNPSTNDTINFIDSSRDDDGIIVSWFWDFDDGTTSNEISPTHRFNEGKNYKIYLTVVDDDGDSNTIRKDVIVVDNTDTSDEERGFIIIYIMFIIVFIVLIGIVIRVSRKYSK